MLKKMLDFGVQSAEYSVPISFPRVPNLERESRCSVIDKGHETNEFPVNILECRRCLLPFLLFLWQVDSLISSADYPVFNPPAIGRRIVGG